MNGTADEESERNPQVNKGDKMRGDFTYVATCTFGNLGWFGYFTPNPNGNWMLVETADGLRVVPFHANITA